MPQRPLVLILVCAVFALCAGAVRAQAVALSGIQGPTIGLVMGTQGQVYFDNQLIKIGRAHV